MSSKKYNIERSFIRKSAKLCGVKFKHVPAASGSKSHYVVTSKACYVDPMPLQASKKVEKRAAPVDTQATTKHVTGTQSYKLRKSDIIGDCVVFVKDGEFYNDECYGSLTYCLSVIAKLKQPDDIVSIDTLSTKV